ncbi:MAG TPA: flagellar motor stator protein MotA [Vicinamibacterales bacterium]|nr:flagellar motor stator protein MotA [Vicinamibacterales bacterium]
MFLVIGVVVVVGCVVGGFAWEGGHLAALNQPAEFLIIGGAAAGSILISTPVQVLTLMVSQLKSLFGKHTDKSEYVELLSLQYLLFRLSQQSGVMALESHVEDPAASPIISRFPGFLGRPDAVDFLSDSFKVIIAGGISAHDLDELMQEDIEIRRDEALRPAHTLTKIGDALPGLGIVAAVLGVVITMAAIDGPPEEIGIKVGAALVGTFLGILLSYGFAQPVATKLEHYVHDESHYLQCIKTGVLASYKGFPAAIATEFARRVVPGHMRPAFDETEQACRTAARPDAVAA